MPLLPDVYQETKRIARGAAQKSPLLAEFSAWCQETYGIDVLNFEFDERNQFYQLVVIVKNEHDYGKMADRSVRDIYRPQIAQTFLRLAAKHNFEPASRREAVGVTFSDFSEDAKRETFQNATDAIKKLVAKRYPMVWHVEVQFHPVTVFYLTDADIATYEGDGTTQRLRAAIYDIVKKHDELDYFTIDSLPLHINSKEYVDTHCEGSLFYYFK